MGNTAAKNDAIMAVLSGPVINKKYTDADRLKSLNLKFKKDGYVKLPEFITDDLFSSIDKEVKRTFAASSRKDFVMPEYKTPRNLCVVSGEQILENSTLLPIIYGSQELRESLSTIVGDRLNGVYHKHEFMVSNHLEKEGDTHGWHLDDPKYALVIILESPAESVGGDVEIINNWRELCEEHKIDPMREIKDGVGIASRKNLIKVVSHVSGDCYLLNASNCLHRVTPLESHKYKRRVLNMAFDDREVISFGGTADMLYGMLSEAEGEVCE